MRVEWSDKLSVGYTPIDLQHKELINRVNMLLSAMAEGQGRNKLAETIKFIEEYVVVHFGMEEELMQKYKYPGYVLHKMEHEKLVSDFLEKKAVMEAGSPTSSDVIKTYNWLADWVSSHIKSTDIKLGPFLARVDK